MKKSHQVAIDTDGKPLPFTPTQVQDVVDRAIKGGDMILVVFRTEGDSLAAQVFGPPSEEIAVMLETLAKAYRKGMVTPEHGGE